MNLLKFNQDKQLKNGEPQPLITRQLLLFGVGWLGLNAIALIVSLLIRSYLQSIYPDPLELANALAHISFGASVNIISYVILLAALGILSFDTTKLLLNSFYRISNIVKGLGYGGLVLLAGMALNVIYLVLEVPLSDNANESTITAIMKNYPVFSFIAFVIAGPVCEELTYRLGLFGFLNRVNRYVAYGVTFIFFGLIHFAFETKNIVNELLNLPFYLIAGLLFCYIYEKEGLAVATYAHITNNFISFVISLFNTGLVLRMV